MALALSSDPPPPERRGVNIQRSFQHGVWTDSLISGERFSLRGLGLNSERVEGAGGWGMDGRREGGGWGAKLSAPGTIHILSWSRSKSGASSSPCSSKT